MCGIVGFFCFGEDRPALKTVRDMFLESESRGNDATGYGCIGKDGSLIVEKEAVEASKFVKRDKFKRLAEINPKFLIGHTRYTTKGTEANNLNNHPVMVGESWALVHNGMVNNDDAVFDRLKMKRSGQVDTEVLVRCMEKEGDFLRGVKLISKECAGSIAFASIWKDEPDRMLIGRSNNPVEFLFDKDRDIVYFGSTTDIVRKADMMAGKKKWRGLRFDVKSPHVYTMERDKAMLFGPEGVEKVVDFNVSYNDMRAPTVIHSYERFGGDWGRWARMDNGEKKDSRCDICRKVQYVKWYPRFTGWICKDCFEDFDASMSGWGDYRGKSDAWRMEKCSKCCKYLRVGDMIEFSELKVCEKCWDFLQDNACESCCGEPANPKDLIQVGNQKICGKCYDKDYKSIN